ncbi:hypothetical protein WH47_01958 [Habropoda laboriosa]|uniref:Uncharacterized protein n=1 Tax=Habropoda laboriosa TaxID=597456 RepID=A0A0L7QXX5_9HYME|nr:hypothetical protein WH47_01958 [Habropoda laboriosa]
MPMRQKQINLSFGWNVSNSFVERTLEKSEEFRYFEIPWICRENNSEYPELLRRSESINRGIPVAFDGELPPRSPRARAVCACQCTASANLRCEREHRRERATTEGKRKDLGEGGEKLERRREKEDVKTNDIGRAPWRPGGGEGNRGQEPPRVSVFPKLSTNCPQDERQTSLMGRTNRHVDHSLRGRGQVTKHVGIPNAYTIQE